MKRPIVPHCLLAIAASNCMLVLDLCPDQACQAAQLQDSNVPLSDDQGGAHDNLFTSYNDGHFKQTIISATLAVFAHDRGPRCFEPQCGKNWHASDVPTTGRKWRDCHEEVEEVPQQVRHQQFARRQLSNQCALSFSLLFCGFACSIQACHRIVIDCDCLLLIRCCSHCRGRQ